MHELVRTTGSDGREYAVVPLQWTFEKVEHYWEHISKFPIFSDDMEKSTEGFMSFVLNSGALWFENLDIETGDIIGLMYLTDIKASHKGFMTEATWHSMVWDSKAGPRRPVAQAAIAAMFRTFGFHRLRAEIPVRFGGVIRQARKIGFRPEGRLREARQYDGIWSDSLILSILESEVGV